VVKAEGYFYNELSNANLKKIANGQVPRVDEQFMDDFLRHHHMVEAVKQCQFQNQSIGAMAEYIM